MVRIGVVSFLNSRPLIEGLGEQPGVELLFEVPALLPGRLNRGEVDVALVPVVDLLRRPGQYSVVSDACIASDGETMTVRVFSQVPPDRVQTLWVDPDSHTSVALAAVIWSEMYDRRLNLQPFDPRSHNIDDFESVLLIGDKVVDQRRGSFAYEVDLGGAWRQQTGLPFVFAVWARRNDEYQMANSELNAAARPSFDIRHSLFSILSSARDRGVSRADSIAREQGPALGWPVALAERYLTRCLKYKLDARTIEGANLFARLCGDVGIVPHTAEIEWPAVLAAGSTLP